MPCHIPAKRNPKLQQSTRLPLLLSSLSLLLPPLPSFPSSLYLHLAFAVCIFHAHFGFESRAGFNKLEKGTDSLLFFLLSFPFSFLSSAALPFPARVQPVNDKIWRKFNSIAPT